MEENFLDLKKNKCSPPKIRNKAGMSALTICIQNSAGSASQCNKTRKETKRHTYQKRIKLFLSAYDNDTLTENLKDSIKQILLEP